MKRIFLYAILYLGAAGLAFQVTRMDSRQHPPLESGLEVYLGEGCIHCHSQYRRPVGIDAPLWGPPSDPAREIERHAPVLFGNRRQGPDLSNVGLRRSRQWNRLHLINPRGLRSASRMPSYGYLFEGEGARGEALLDYLQSLGEDQRDEWTAFVGQWQAPAGSWGGGDPDAGASLYQSLCSGCHGSTGRGDGPLAASLAPAPRNLRDPARWYWVPRDPSGVPDAGELARLIRFGRPGTAMAGTEWLTQSEIEDLIGFLRRLAQSTGSQGR